MWCVVWGNTFLVNFKFEKSFLFDFDLWYRDTLIICMLESAAKQMKNAWSIRGELQVARWQCYYAYIEFEM